MKRLLGLARSRAAVFLHDLVMIPIAWLGAYWLRSNLGNIPPQVWTDGLAALPFVVVAQGLMFWYFGLYRGVWRFASIPDLVRIVKAVLSGVALAAAAIFFFSRLQGVPRSILVLDAGLLLLLLGGPRLIYRLYKDRHQYARSGRKVLIVGAGQAGEMLARDLLRDPERHYQPVAFVDDDARKQRKEIHGIRVTGTVDSIAKLVPALEIDTVLLALPSATARQIRRVVEICEKTGVPFRILPRMQDLVAGEVGLQQLREVRLEDLLGRDPVSLDWQAITEGIRHRTVLVSGGGGSIGSELCRQVARLGPARLIVFEHAEYNLYAIEHELRRDYPNLALTAILGDVCDEVAVDATLATHRPEAIFHAAAYKHVPLLEGQARIAAINNVLGTRTLAAAADRHGCKAFVMISTDKAVNPANVMGTTKRVAEIYCQDLNARSRTRYITVRFGNVLGSAGSVIPLFQKQIAAGGPVTVTHAEITRYFMTIPEASQLILQAGVIGQGGEIFVLDMGEPVKINYLAEQLIRLSGKKPGEDIEIVYTGLRPGEKLYEELFHSAEQLAPTAHPKIRLARSRQLDHVTVERAIAELERTCRGRDEAAVMHWLHELVPEQTGARSAVVVPLKAR